MKEDDKRIQKFLELLPDDAMENIFYSLSTSSMIKDFNTYLMDGYLNYIRKFNLLFKNKNLHKKHSEFYKSFNELDTFILRNFFHENHQDQIFCLYDSSFRERLPERYEEFKKQLQLIVNQTEEKYNQFRKSIEEYKLENDIEINTTNTGNKIHLEEINFNKIGIKIIGKTISGTARKNKVIFNKADEKIIYFLYNRYKNDKNEYFTKEIIAKELTLSPNYIKNRISVINNKIPEYISIYKTGFMIIDNEETRGYRINPKNIK